MTAATPAPKCAPPDRETTLLPCPFCGSGDVQMDRFSGESDTGYGVTCENKSCGAIGPSEGLTRLEATKAWNAVRRAPAHPPQPVDPEVVECVSLEEGMPHGERFAVIGWTGFDQAVVREERDGCLLVFNPEDFVRVTAPRRAAAILRGEPDPAGGV